MELVSYLWGGQGLPAPGGSGALFPLYQCPDGNLLLVPDLLCVPIYVGCPPWWLHSSPGVEVRHRERALLHCVVLAARRRALPARNARHPGGVGGWAASSPERATFKLRRNEVYVCRTPAFRIVCLILVSSF